MKMVKSLLLVSDSWSRCGFGKHSPPISRKGQAGRIREGLLPVRCWVLLRPGH